MWLRGVSSFYYIDTWGVVWQMKQNGEASPTLYDTGLATRNGTEINMPCWGALCLRARDRLVQLYLSVKPQVEKMIHDPPEIYN